MTDNELPLLSKPRVDRIVFVDTAAKFNDCISELALGKGPFALDAERASGFKYSQRAYLIQIHRFGSAIFLIDPIAIVAEIGLEPFTRLNELLSTNEWILHAASQDIPCLAELGIKPNQLFDTELGSRLAGLPRVGLGAVTEHYLQIRLAKEHSAVDWSTRPLHEDWLNYAALDVDVLIELREKVIALLKQQGKLEWAKQEFAAVAKMTPKPPKIDRWRGVTGMHEVKDARTMAIVKSIWTARENLAEKLDVSPGRLIPDSSIVAAALNPPKTKPELASMKTFSGRASRSYLDLWWQAIAEGVATRDLPQLRISSSEVPNHRTWAKRFPEADRRLKFVREALVAKAEEIEMPVENLLTPDFARNLCWEPPSENSREKVVQRLESLGSRPWQIEQTAELIATALDNAAKPEITDSNVDPESTN
ncbi:MAG: HRDC domain-containing protein [Rhodoluna sp.]